MLSGISAKAKALNVRHWPNSVAMGAAVLFLIIISCASFYYQSLQEDHNFRALVSGTCRSHNLRS